MQRSQSKILRAIANAPRYVTNHTLHTYFNIPYVSDVIHERINKHHNKLEAHPIPLLEPLLTYLLTYSMVQSLSWEANWSAASQETPRISRTPKVHYCTHKRPPPVSILGQPNPVHIPTSHLLEIHPNIICSSTPRSPQWSPSLRFPH